MHCEPQRAFRYLLYRMRRFCGQEDVIAGLERLRCAVDVENCGALDEQYPFVLFLHEGNRRSRSGTDDAFDDEVLVLQEGLEAFALRRRKRIVVEISAPHGRLTLAVKCACERREHRVIFDRRVRQHD